MSREETLKRILDALREICASDEHEWIGTSLLMEVIDRTAVSKATAYYCLETLKALGVVSGRLRVRQEKSSGFGPRRIVYRWVLLMPDAQIKKDESGFYRIAEDEE